MKVAVAVKNNLITDHFGHCDYFLVHDIDNAQVQGTQIIKNPPHEKGFLPNFLHQQGVDVIITGNLGETALAMLMEYKIKVYRGVTGNVSEIIDKYLHGTLESSDIVCREHLHHGQE
jgi:predicted Fe-Mo cluster-binding NifX family protein